MAKKIGTLIKEARTGAGLTQAQLAEKVAGLSPSDISKAERGEKDLPQDMLKKIAKACGVTQSSLLNASGTAKKTAAKKTTTKKLTPAKETAEKAPKKTVEKTSTLKLTADEKKLVELYRKAGSQKQEEALKVLQEEDDNPLLNVLGDVLGALLK